ncbi:MAG TPA: hypothetical protein VMB05_07270 [Solirubrobacteraceae bacterium]|nr:hypothetical protein [Solirubrobacteraceae bacterium]
MLHALLCLLPIAAIAVPLLARRYPGERILLAFRRPERRRFPRPRSSAPLSWRRVPVLAARGGELLARSLAVRPPPALASAS